MKKYFVYILLTVDKCFYCGYTDDVEKRFKKHFNGVGAKYTRMHKPEKILYTKEFETKEEALREEVRIKKLNRRQKEEFLKELNIKF